MNTETMNTDLEVLLRMVDEAIVDLGVSSLVDGRSARDKLLDVRSLVSKLIVVPETV